MLAMQGVSSVSEADRTLAVGKMEDVNFAVHKTETIAELMKNIMQQLRGAQ